MMIGNAASAPVYLFASDFIGQALPQAPAWMFPVLAMGGILNVVFAVALFQWKKWGFYGFVATAAIALAINLSMGLGIGNHFLDSPG